jgi:hypothetical protein
MSHVTIALDLRQFVNIPVPSEGFDQHDAGVELSAPDIDASFRDAFVI